MSNNTAFLVGFMGSGKSSILDILKLNTEINTIDLDDIVLEESEDHICLLYTSPSPRDRQKSRMPSSA